MPGTMHSPAVDCRETRANPQSNPRQPPLTPAPTSARTQRNAHHSRCNEHLSTRSLLRELLCLADLREREALRDGDDEVTFRHGPDHRREAVGIGMRPVVANLD